MTNHKTDTVSTSILESLAKTISGELYFDATMRKLYSTDASSYRELPLAVCYPKTDHDIKLLIDFVNDNKTSLIPRTAGTSLAGQVVGGGIIVDVSKYFNKILELNTQEGWVKVQPGVVRDELNKYLKPFGFLFGPETSTANRAMIGGMIGNNSCGSNSVVYGSTRDHLISVDALLSDGTRTVFGPLEVEEFNNKVEGEGLESNIYSTISGMLSDQVNRNEIFHQFPKKSIPRRNTGYAIDLLADTKPFDGINPFNFSTLLAGSEGTLAFTLEAKLKIQPLPPKHSALVCIHFDDLYQSLEATKVALHYQPYAVELMDHFILECTKENVNQAKNRFFVQGDPKAIIVVELKSNTEKELDDQVDHLISTLKQMEMGYHFPIVKGEDIRKVWTLRKAGLGLLSNIPGDAKPVPVIEDTAVDVEDLPDFIKDFNNILDTYNLECVHYAHAGSGELHLRPILDLKTAEGNKLFKDIATEISVLVKKYKGSLSGEHGDGRLRGEFIPYMIGDRNYDLLKSIKKTWDPNNIFNPGKIVNTPSMNQSLRFMPGYETPQVDTILDFSKTGGMIQTAEQCNGSGDCRKSELIGGTMCPSYMATRNEKDTTRARANILREVTYERRSQENVFQSEEIKEVLDLCLSCKGCKSECPSNVDMAKLKAEFQYQYYKDGSIPLRTRLIGHVYKLNKLASVWPGFYNFLMRGPFHGIVKHLSGFAYARSLPKMGKYTVSKWVKRNSQVLKSKDGNGKMIILFIDEFTNYFDVEVGIKTIKLLNKLGYSITVYDSNESGRAYLSKGMLGHAKRIAETNVNALYKRVNESTPLVGIEPSAIYSFRDEYPDLLRGDLKEKANELATNTYSLEEFLAKELESGTLKSSAFNDKDRNIILHGHCHQKAISSLTPIKKILSLPENYKVQLIPSGCCGMAGSFGYEKEHYDLSMKIGSLVLFPRIQETDNETIIAASGTSCRHQILDGTGRRAKHTAEILYDALSE